MGTRMTLTAWHQGMANAMVCAIGVFGAWLSIGWLVSLATDMRLAQCGAVAFAILWVGCLLGLVAGWVVGLMRRGELLLDCGGHATSWLFLTCAVFFAVAGLGSSLASRCDTCPFGAIS